MNPMLINKALRELPEYMIQDYLNGRASESERKIVESLMHLPENEGKIKSASENILPPPDASRIQRMMNLAKEYGVPATVELSESPDVKVEAGQIWSLKQYIAGKPGSSYLPIAQSQYIFILTNPVPLSEALEISAGSTRLYFDDEFVEYLPVSINTELANQHDMIIPAENSILGVEFMIQTEINSTTLCLNLDNCFGKLSEEETEKLLNLYFFTHKMGHDFELLGNTETGTEHYNAGSSIVEFKKVEFENSRIIAEPVDDFVGYLNGLTVIQVSKEAVNGHYFTKAAATNNVDVAKLKYQSSQTLYEDVNIKIAVNYYKETGYYFNVVVASEVCDGKFKFTVANRSAGSKTLVLSDNLPGEYFFAFYNEFVSGIYEMTVETGDRVILKEDFFLEMNGE